MKQQLLDLLKQGFGVDLWYDTEASPSERFVVLIYRDGEASNYYGRTLAQAIGRAANKDNEA